MAKVITVTLTTDGELRRVLIERVVGSTDITGNIVILETETLSTVPSRVETNSRTIEFKERPALETRMRNAFNNLELDIKALLYS